MEPTAGAISLPANVAWSFTGSFVYAACQGGMLIVLARLGSPLDVGLYSLALAVTAPLFLLAGLQLRTYLATDAAGEHTFADYLGLRLLSSLAALGAAAACALLLPSRASAVPVIVLVGGTKAVEAVTDIFHGLFQARQRMDLVARSLMRRGLLSLVTLAGGMALTRSLGVSVGLVLAGWAALLLVQELRWAAGLLRGAGRVAGQAAGQVAGQAAARIRPAFRRERLRALVAATLPLGVAGMLASLCLSVPRLAIEHFLGTEQVGIFSALAYAMVAGQLLAAAVCQSCSARLSLAWLERGRAYRGLLLRAVVLSTGSGLVGLLLAVRWGEPLLNLVYGPLYASHADLLDWIMVATAISTMQWPLSLALTAARKLRVQFWLRLLTVGLVLGLCLWLVPARGLVGAAWALGAAFAVQALGMGAAVLAAGRERAVRQRAAAPAGGRP